MLVAMVGQKGIPASLGGVERYVEELTARLPEHGIQALVYARPWYVRHAPQYRPPEGVQRILLPSVPTKHFDTISHVLACVADIALRTDVDLVHVHCLGPALVTPLLRLLRVPVVVSVQGLDWQRAKWGPVARRVLRSGEWCACRFANRVVVASPALVDYFESQHGIRATYVPNAASAFPFQPPQRIKRWGLIPGQFVLAATRLVPEKGLHLLLQAYARLQTDWRLVIAGGSMYEDGYEQSLRALADDRVVFTGPADRQLLAELYHHAGLFVLPSLIEGMSLALLEALHHGLPCLVSDIPENAAVIRHPAGLFRSGDVDHLAQCLDQLLNDRQLRDQLSRYALSEAKRYGWDSVTQAMAEVYREVVAEAGRAGQAAVALRVP